MTVVTDAAPSENLSTEDAIGLLAGLPEEPAPEPVEAEPAPEEQPAEAPEGEAEEETPEGEPEQPEEPSEPAPEPPPFWSPEDKAVWSEVPQAAAEAIRRHEDNRNRATAHALQQTAEARKAAEAQAAQLAQLAPQLAAVADQAQQMFDRPVEGLTDSQGNQLQPVKWSEINWTAWHKADPVAATVAHSRYQAEMAELQQVQAAKQFATKQAEDKAFVAYLQEEGQRLQTLNPTLATDAGKRQELGQYLISRGYPPEALRGASALDLDTAFKAYQWDQLQAKAQKAPKPGETPPRKTTTPSKTVKPSAAAPGAPSKNRVLEQASNRFAQTGSTDDAVRVLLARGGG